jgi:hypothetical protein
VISVTLPGTPQRTTLRSGATLHLKDAYAAEAQQYDVCDVRGKICF